MRMGIFSETDQPVKPFELFRSLGWAAEEFCPLMCC
jgi:hypothetical protein